MAFQPSLYRCCTVTVGYTKQGTCPLIASTYSPDAIKGFVSTIKGHLRNRCGFGRTAHARCHTITVPIRAADAEVASGGARGGAARLGGLWLRGRAAGRALISEGASAVCTSHQSASVGSRTRRTTMHETAGGFACPLLRDLCPLYRTFFRLQTVLSAFWRWPSRETRHVSTCDTAQHALTRQCLSSRMTASNPEHP